MGFAALSGCGGAGGGAGPTGSGQGLVLLSFSQDGVDNLNLNAALEFVFSEPVDDTTIDGTPNTVTSASIQVREGDAFGRSVPGMFRVNGAVVRFEPQLPGLCDFSDAGLRPDTRYRVQVIGHPEEFAVRNTRGQPLNQTTTYEFDTLPDQDPNLLLDQVPATPPAVTNASPADGSAAVGVEAGNQIVLEVSENLDPCSVTHQSVILRMYETGDPNQFFVPSPGDNASGFVKNGSIADQLPNDPFSWGADNTKTWSPPQALLYDVQLVQDFESTKILVTPASGRFPENALVVLQLTLTVADFGGQSLVPFTMSFTTENLPLQDGTYVLENEGETSYLTGQTTADVNTARAPSRVQGYMLFAGDGDNGSDIAAPASPEDNPPACTHPRQANDGTRDEFDPVTDVVLDTGNSPNLCPNSTDGSRAVVYEFRTFRVRDGITVRIVGVNAAIILVQGDVRIDTGGTLLVRGDQMGGAPRGQGTNGSGASSSTPGKPGGKGVAGGGNGGDSNSVGSKTYGDDGFSGIGSQDYDPAMTPNGIGEGGFGAGEGGVADKNSDTFGTGASQGGGGGAHATQGFDGAANPGLNLYGSVHTYVGTPRGKGGQPYPSGSSADLLLTPSAGSGGGAAGDSRGNGSSWDALGGSGGAGGGFVDITSAGNITIHGTIDAAGSRGGNGYYDASFTASGGGGGGAGGGIRVLTPNDIDVAGGLLTTAGGSGGTASSPTNAPNHGGAGGSGRIVLEDGDSVIQGIAGAQLIPSEGDPGFYRSAFSATRFQGGGLRPEAVTDLFAAGPLDPDYVDPVQDYGVLEDFIAGIPGEAAVAGKTAILIEARGYEMKADATPDLGSGTPWHTVGYFTDSTVENLPTWNLGQPPLADIGGALPPGNTGVFGISNLDGKEFLQLRITIFLPVTVGPFTPGPFLDRWTIRFQSDQ